ncbi:hypothetical protein ACJ73_03005 [Blastomyces percursus]|uniref:DEAD/DEAH-box helicase domain-containing protein n=1 Tax=Blastomyces percursus TaxID=1658174 RepID=A0A1J9QAS3_9EURO|nr:hypothetical protein ACJ73_03005 [Blastomyces percursus]
MRVSELFGFKPRKEQLDCLQVLKAKKDLILLAKTGFGKSVIFQAMPMLDPHCTGTCIVIMSLIALQDDQAASINKRGGRWKACVLNATTKTPELLHKIRKGMYTHILLGAEVAVAKDFAQVLKDPVFRRKPFEPTIHAWQYSVHEQQLKAGCRSLLHPQGKGKNIVQELLADEEEQAEQEKAPGGTVAAPATAGHKKNTTQCTRMPEKVISCLYNKGCLRREILTYFDNMPDVWIERDRCCSSCNPELARLPVITELEHPKDEYQSAPKAAGPFIRKKLEEWQDKAAQQLAEDHPMSIAGTKKCILKPERLDSWIKNAMALRVREEDPNQPIPLWHWSVDEFRRVNSDWHWLDRRGFAVGVVEAIKKGFQDYLNSIV